MLNLLQFANAASALAMVVSLVLLFRGIYSLISGKCSLRRYKVKGKQGRIAGLVLVGQFIVGAAISASLHEANNWGSSSQSISEGITEGFTNLIIFSLAILVGYLAARAIAKAGWQEKKRIA